MFVRKSGSRLCIDQIRFGLSNVKQILYYSQDQFRDEVRDNSQYEVVPNPEKRRFSHKPVMVREVLHHLQPQKGQIILDMTFGAGGHSKKLLESCEGDLTILALDRDPEAIKYANELSHQTNYNVSPLLGKFSDLDTLLPANNIRPGDIDGVLMDIGCSSMQMDDPDRGFALSSTGPLDMRMDCDRDPDQPSAYDVIATLDEGPLAAIIKRYGEERGAKKIARALIDARFMLKSIRTTTELANVVASALENEVRTDKLDRPAHVATKTFQAFRIFVNNELNELDYGLQMAAKYLKPEGRLVAITFHSLEDKIVKQHLRGVDMDETVNAIAVHKFRSYNSFVDLDDITKLYDNRWTRINKKVVLPTNEEVARNPRCRSAKLRAAIKNC